MVYLSLLFFVLSIFIKKCNIVSNRRRDQVTAFAFITFENRSDAGEAKNDAHGMDIEGRE